MSRRRAICRWCTALLLGGLPLAPLTAQSAAPPAVEIRWGVRVPMRDGITLHATVYQPAGTRDRVPVILSMTPYTTDELHGRGQYFAQRGYVFAAVDVRGRGNSGGVYAPFEHDGVDGYDTVEWLAQWPRGDGQVAMWGGSYGGFAQWATAARRPPHLRTIVPAAAVYPGVDFPTLRGLTFVSSLFWLAGTGGVTLNWGWDGDGAYWAAWNRARHQDDRRWRALDTLSGFPSAIWQRWLDADPGAAYWRAMVPSAAEYAAIDIPVLTITGSYDVDQPGALRYYREHLAARGDQRTSSVLLFGPWDHAGTRTPRRQFAGVTMGPRSVLDLAALHVAWYDHVLKGAQRPPTLPDAVRWYDAASDTWRNAPSLAAITARHDTIHLGRPGDWRVPGRSTAAPAMWTVDVAHDLRDPLALDRDLATDPFDYGSAARVQALGPQALVVELPPSGRTRALAGAPRVEVALSCAVSSVDVMADLYVVAPGGRTRWIAGDAQRVTCPRSAAPATPVLFDHFTTMTAAVRAGERVRVVLSPAHLGLFLPNYGGTGRAADQRRTDAQPGNIRWSSDPERPARLLLPRARPN
jgi:putative CocE/NonD family hydrolase